MVECRIDIYEYIRFLFLEETCGECIICSSEDVILKTIPCTCRRFMCVDCFDKVNICPFCRYEFAPFASQKSIASQDSFDFASYGLFDFTSQNRPDIMINPSSLPTRMTIRDIFEIFDRLNDDDRATLGLPIGISDASSLAQPVSYTLNHIDQHVNSRIETSYHLITTEMLYSEISEISTATNTHVVQNKKNIKIHNKINQKGIQSMQNKPYNKFHKKIHKSIYRY